MTGAIMLAFFIFWIYVAWNLKNDSQPRNRKGQFKKVIRWPSEEYSKL